MDGLAGREARGFWIIAAAVAVAMFASAALSPLYPVYQRLWGFSSATLTIVFAVYAGPLLISLLTVGALSDHIGRRPVVIGSLLILTMAMVVFAAAESVTMLLAARLVQGLATGAAVSALTAAMVDLQPSRSTGTLAVAMAPIAGLGFGVAVSALLVEYAPAPRQLVYLFVIVVLLALVFAVVKVVPETSTRSESRTRITRTLIPRVSVPEQARSAFVAGTPALVATWALGGLMLALGTSITADRLGVTNHAAGGALLAVFFFAATVATPWASAPRRPMRLPASYACLGGGVALVLVAALTGSVFAYAVALVAAGAGFSTAYVGVIASLAHVPAAQRGQLFAAVYVVSYLAFGVPVVISGVAADRYGLGPTVSGYAVFVLAMVGLAAVALRLRRVPEPAITRPDRDRAPVIARP